jgi:glycogen debranching enzyme
LRWDVAIGPGQSWEVVVTISSIQTSGTLFRSADQAGLAWSKLRVSAGDVRLTRLVDRGLQDLAGLLLVDPLEPRDRFIAAGAPWFLTLFGRDSLWAARFMLPTGTAIAASTLRTLARRQGRVVDAERAEEPGKILHEVRRADLGADIPFAPVYYGTVDATPLWICLLCDAWRWGMADADVAELIPNLERALAWMRDFGDADGDGFLEYRPSSVDGQGLSNQGWKDSDDAIQWLDGRLAESPIALCEVQGYAYEAATKAAALLDAFRRPGADGWRTWAEQLGKRFRDAFWVDNHGDSYPAIALDRHKHRVDAASSNIGHLLSTGILDDHECELVARRLAKLDMDSGWGLRTMTAASPRFNPLSYHGGSVWPHDTAIAIMGLAATGHGDVAASLSGGLVAAAEAFDFRLPELYGGHQAEAGRTPIPYPAACRPQAWAAVVGVAIVTALLGVRPDVPAGRVEIAPLDGQPFGALVVDGVVIGGRAVRIQHDGLTTTLTGAAPGLSIDISHTLVPLPSVG